MFDSELNKGLRWLDKNKWTTEWKRLDISREARRGSLRVLYSMGL